VTLILVAYDVNTETPDGRRRLRRVAKVCENYGQRVQNSVFECWVDHSQFIAMRASLIREFDSARDSLRFYLLGENWKGKVEHHGTQPSYDPSGPMII
jgi:CRISPR-associated protein Cas2